MWLFFLKSYGIFPCLINSLFHQCSDCKILVLTFYLYFLSFLLKEFVEEVKDKEEDMSAIMKSADSFKGNAQVSWNPFWNSSQFIGLNLKMRYTPVSFSIEHLYTGTLYLRSNSSFLLNSDKICPLVNKRLTKYRYKYISNLRFAILNLIALGVRHVFKWGSIC